MAASERSACTTPLVPARRSAKAAESAVVPGRRLPAPVEVDEVIELWERSFETERYRATLTNRGGGLKSWELKEYF